MAAVGSRSITREDQGLNPGGEDGLEGHQHQKQLSQATQELQGHLWILETNPSDPNGGTTAETVKPSFSFSKPDFVKSVSAPSS